MKTIGDYKPIFKIVVDDKKIEEIERKEQERLLREREQERKQRLESIIPPRYKHASFETFEISTPLQKRAIEFLKTGRSCIMFGPNGTGKTHLAFSTIRNEIMHGRDARYILAAELFDRVRHSFADKTIRNPVKEFETCDYLVIDEVDKRYGSPTEFIALYRLINERYNQMLPTMLISNAGKDELVDVIGSSSFDRIREDGKIINLDGESFRRRKGA